MVLVPPDAAIRLRMQTEANLLEAVQPTRPIPADLPDLRPGQAFQARILEPLPDDTYRALVAGKQLTLQLPEGAKAGDQLELVVIDRSPRAIIAQRVATSGAPEAAAAYPFMRLSPTARLIGALLPPPGEMASPTPLDRGQPLLAATGLMQAPAAQLAATLEKAVSECGVFYEAHLAEWVQGKRPLAELMREPQARFAQPQIAFRAPPERPMTGESAPAATETTTAARQAAPQAATGGIPQIPDPLRPIVQQQLEAAASQRILWHGEVWPQQTLEWAIEWEGERTGGEAEEEATWRTSLTLTTPRLGRIEARLQLTAQGVRMMLAAEDEHSAAELRAALGDLSTALARAGVPLLQCSVET